MCSVLHVYVLSGVMLLVEDSLFMSSGVMLLVEDLHVFSSTCLCPLWCNVVSRGPSCVQFYMFMSSLV